MSMYINLAEAEDWERFIENFLGVEIDRLDNDRLAHLHTFFSYQTDRLASELAYRGLVKVTADGPLVPIKYPRTLVWPKSITSRIDNCGDHQ